MIREMHDATKGRAAIDDSLNSCKYVYDMRMKLENALAQHFGDGNHSPSARSINEEIRKCSDPLMVIARALWLYDSVPTDAQSNVAAVMDRVAESAKANLNAVNAELIAKNAHEVATAARDRQSWDLTQDALRAVRGTTAYATVGADSGGGDVGFVTVWRRRALELQAIQWNGKWTDDGTRVLDFTGTSGNWNGAFLEIKTKSGAYLTAVAGDWIVRKAHGQISIIPDDVFREEYYQLYGSAAGNGIDDIQPIKPGGFTDGV